MAGTPTGCVDPWPTLHPPPGARHLCAQAKLSEDAIRERAKAALLGGIIADAATMGLHWWVTQLHSARRVSSFCVPPPLPSAGTLRKGA